MMSRQEVVPPVKRETGCSAVIRVTFSLGNNQTCTDCRRISGINAPILQTNNLRADSWVAKVLPPVKKGKLAAA